MKTPETQKYFLINRFFFTQSSHIYPENIIMFLTNETQITWAAQEIYLKPLHRLIGL